LSLNLGSGANGIFFGCVFLIVIHFGLTRALDHIY
jgi:hypothetical protein